MTFPNISKPEFFKIKTRDEEIEISKNQTEKHDHENILKSNKNENENYRKKYKSLNKKKVIIIITESLIGAGLTFSSSTLAILNPSVGIIISSSTALLTSIAILITIDYISKLKLRYTKLRDWINFVTILYEKILMESMVDKKTDEKKLWN